MLDPRLVEIVARNLNLQPAMITPATNPLSVAAWDSVSHLQMILDIEESFGVRFPAEQLGELNSVGGIQTALEADKTLTHPGRLAIPPSAHVPVG